MELEYIIRIVAASACGFFVGMERSHRSKEAGVRTHCIVAMGAALMMIISKYGFADTAQGMNGMRGADGARIAAQVVSGIGFLGAGMIFVRRDTITGLTTAAGIWATSGIGMAIGAGMYVIGVAATGIIIVVQAVLHMKFAHHKEIRRVKVKVKEVEQAGTQEQLMAVLEENGLRVNDVSAEYSNGMFNYSFYAETEKDIVEEEVLLSLGYNASISSVKA